MSVVRDLILQADDELRYPSGGELRSMVDFLSGGSARLKVARILSENEQKIVAESVIESFPEMKFIGKTNKGNLVFENKNQQLKVTPNGQIL